MITEATISRAQANQTRRAQDQRDAAEAESFNGYLSAYMDFLGRVARGEDTPTPATRDGGPNWKVSQLLDPGEEARHLLFAACREASNGRDCANLLRQFVEQCAKDYAEDRAERYL